MTVNACEQNAPADAAFCAECGGEAKHSGARNAAPRPPQTTISAGKCGARVTISAAPPATRFAAPDAYTPKHLAEKILTSKGALEGERKQVTVLFADLKGSMELLADRDPEEARKLLDPVLERMMEAVHRYEGTVNQVMGDGIMALFGAPARPRGPRGAGLLRRARMQEPSSATPRRSASDRGCPAPDSGRRSTPARWSSGPSAATCTWTTRPSGRRPTWPPAWSRWPMPGSILIAPETLQSGGRLRRRSSRSGPVPVKGLARARRGLRADRRRDRRARGSRRPPPAA